MPKIPIDYNNTLIYKLCHKEDYDNANIYIGSTTNFTKRKNQYKLSCLDENAKEYHQKKYQCIRDNGGWDNCNMIEIEKYPFNDKREAAAKEEYWRTYFAVLNSIKCYSSSDHKKEKNAGKCKKYCENNKVKIAEYLKEYCDNNKGKIAITNKNYCENNKGKIAKYLKEYRDNNKERINQKRREYQAKQENKTIKQFSFKITYLFYFIIL